jgi:disulfide bond formation protein DsbB
MHKSIYLYIAFALALTATLGSLFMSGVLGWAPCVLCWYQRIMLYPLVIIFAVAILKGVNNLKHIVLPMTIIGGLVALYHMLLQYKIIPEALGPCVNGVSCVTSYHLGPNFVTVPLLALLSFIAIGILTLMHGEEEHE